LRFRILTNALLGKVEGPRLALSSGRGGEQSCWNMETLFRRVSTDAQDAAKRCRSSLQLARQDFFSSCTLTGQQNPPLSDSAMIEVTGDKSPSSQCVLTAKIFRITKCQA
jgi:hypothetical protein